MNEIANRAFLTGDTNWTLSDDRPAEYFPEIQGKYPGALQKQCIPTSTEIWKMEHYERFLAERRSMIADAFNQVMKGLLEEAPPPKKTALG